MRILLIEDEAKVAKAVSEGLRKEGYEVDSAHTGEEGFYLLSTKEFDMVLLDLMLPGRSGLEILRSIREGDNPIPVLVLTARDAIEDKVEGLDAGADDYLVKPFAFAELLARIRALQRRGRPDQSVRLSTADLAMDCVARRVTRASTEIALTAKEFELLEYLMRHAGQVVSREMLARHVWQIGERATPLDNVIDVHIARLRRKIDDPFSPKLLKTIRGVGFSLREHET